jgi:hypothetical protein
LRDALTMEELQYLVMERRWQERLISMSRSLAHLPAVAIPDPVVIRHLVSGHLDLDLAKECQSQYAQQGKPVRLLDAHTRDLLALWLPQANGDCRDRLRVFGTNTQYNPDKTTETKEEEPWC